MNYFAHYDRLIKRARSRVPVGYHERHHVVPLCQGGSNSPRNLVYLTPEEHYIAHQLLVKMHPGSRKLAQAAILMSRRCTGNKSYGWLRARHAEAMRGRRLSAETLAKMSASLRGNVKLSEAMRKKRGPHSPERRAKISAAHRGKKLSPEHCAQMAETRRGKKLGPQSPEHRARISAAKLGKKWGPHSPEHRAKISATLRANWQRKSERLEADHSSVVASSHPSA